MGFLFFLPLFLILIVIGSSQYKEDENCEYMINAEWLAAADKFKLITRWGVK